MRKRKPTRRDKRRRRSRDEAAYICPTCGESIVIPLDPTAGAEQSYVEDCPVCCNPNVIHVEFLDLRDNPDDPPRIWADAE